MTPLSRLFIYLLLPLVLIFESAAPALGQSAPTSAPHWEDATLGMFATLPIQDAGRVKPLDTWARFKLIQFSGRQTLRDESGEKTSALAWLLDTLFYPERAADHNIFIVESPQVMQAIGLSDTEKRARFSYRQLGDVEAKLTGQARQAVGVPPRERDRFQIQILNLYHNFVEFDQLLHALDFARMRVSIQPGSRLAEFYPEASGETLALDGVLGQAARVVEALQADLQSGTPTDELIDPATGDLMQMLSDAAHADGLRLFPPSPEAEPAREWSSPASLVNEALSGQAIAAEQLAILGALIAVTESAADPVAFDAALGAFHQQVRASALARDQYRHIGLEVSFYQTRYFRKSLVFFMLSFLLATALWMAPGNRWLYRINWVAVLVPTALLIAGITLRCVIRGRPPVTTLYETTLFVPAVAIVVALVIEWINRRRVGLSMASLFGLVGLFLANKYEYKGGGDTMQSMVAVLDSNFWLATHVTTITIGYSAGLLAAALAHLYILGRVFRLIRDKALFQSIDRMVYGVICFGTFFAFLGTVLGGIWADASWGRFWGWDPKENGALLLILWFLIILHARLGGYIRERGLCVAAVFGGVVVSMSWWGVNLLGVGLHSYGFTSGVAVPLFVFWGVELFVILLGLAAFLLERPERKRA